jgi:hypothetical protein
MVRLDRACAKRRWGQTVELLHDALVKDAQAAGPRQRRRKQRWPHRRIQRGILRARARRRLHAERRLRRPSIGELLDNELCAGELWTGLPAELREIVARVLRKLLKVKEASGDAAKTDAFVDLFVMPIAVLRCLLSGEAGANSPAHQAQSLATRL